MRYRLYSDRLKDAARGGQKDVYQYDEIPKKLRTQLRQIISGAVGLPRRHTPSGVVQNQVMETIREVVCHEKGIDNLTGVGNAYEDIVRSFDSLATEDLLDIIEACCDAIQIFVKGKSFYKRDWETTIEPDEAIDDINFRMRDAGFGFQFEGRSLVRVDSQFLHAEVVKPALALLASPGYEGPQEEFLNAHDHYRAGRYREAITEAAKAFESTMKAVCENKGWDYPAKGRATDLLKVLRTHKLWPDYLDKSFDQLVATLSSGLPQVRNDDAAHGQGSVPTETPPYVAAYALHLAAAKIVLIVKAAEAA